MNCVWLKKRSSCFKTIRFLLFFWCSRAVNQFTLICCPEKSNVVKHIWYWYFFQKKTFSVKIPTTKMEVLKLCCDKKWSSLLLYLLFCTLLLGILLSRLTQLAYNPPGPISAVRSNGDKGVEVWLTPTYCPDAVVSGSSRLESGEASCSCWNTRKLQKHIEQ